MRPYFPRQTVEWALEEISFRHRFTLSIVMMGIVTGIGVRLIRCVALTVGSTFDWIALGLSVALGAILLFGMATLHLSNYPVRRWWWRGPAFGAMDAIGEVATSAVLTALGREPMGTGRASMQDLVLTAATAAWSRPLLCAVFALALGLVVQGVRAHLLKKARSASEVRALNEEFEAAPEPEPHLRIPKT